MKMTKQKFLDLSPCNDAILFAASCDFDAVKAWQTCERGDWLIWLLSNVGLWRDKAQKVEVAIACAEHVLEIFEKKYPDDKLPRLAIETAKKWIENPTPENEEVCRRTAYADYAAAAAYAAYAAADAAYAAYAAAYAADAAADAADADACAAYAYAAAAADAAADAYAADAAADAYAYAADAYAAYAAADAAARQSERKWQADKIRELIPCPFQ